MSASSQDFRVNYAIVLIIIASALDLSTTFNAVHEQDH